MKVSAHCETCNRVTPAKNVTVEVNIETQKCRNITVCGLCGNATEREYEISKSQGYTLYKVA